MTTAVAPTPVSKAAWKKNATHTVTLPSGSVVEIRLPNLPEMIKSGAFPGSLLAVAIKQIKEEDVSADRIKELADYHRFLVHIMLVKPEISEDEVGELPPEDVDMLIAFANRERDTDTVGHHLAGLETHEGFRTFRGLDRSDEGVLDAPSFG